MPALPGAAPAAGSHPLAAAPLARGLAQMDMTLQGEAQAAPKCREKARKKVPTAQLPRVWSPVMALKASQRRTGHQNDCKASQERQAFLEANHP